ncbi:hypothetical protein ACPCTN_32115 [Streptomyces cinereoruber]|uniref:hypothetical protein n=1 Tax=Streptomyces cinereoruber TaxID=67260 RepID=UPI003C2D708D
MNTTMPEVSSTSLRMAVEAARAAAKAAAHTAALILIEADGGQGHIRDGYLERHGDVWCVASSVRFTAYLHADSHGDRAHVELTATPNAYEQMRTWAEDQDGCRHDHGCVCLPDPWPTLADLARSAEEHRIDYRANFEVDQRGTARLAFKRVTVTLFDEPVTVVDTLLRIARSAA